MIPYGKITIACLTKLLNLFRVKTIFYGHMQISLRLPLQKILSFSLNHIHKWHTCIITIASRSCILPDFPKLLFFLYLHPLNIVSVSNSICLLGIQYFTHCANFISANGDGCFLSFSCIRADSILMDHYHNSEQICLLSFGPDLKLLAKLRVNSSGCWSQIASLVVRTVYSQEIIVIQLNIRNFKII